MRLEEIRSLIEAGKRFDYLDTLKNWGGIKISERGSIIEELYWHAEDTSLLPKFLDLSVYNQFHKV